MKILLDYFFPITAIEPTPEASTAFLKQVCLVVSPKNGGVTIRVPVLCTSMSAVLALTDNVEAQQFFNAGMSKVYILPADDLDLVDALDEGASDFFTLVISSDFDDANIAVSAADGTITVTSYANLLTTTPDTVTVNGTVFTAQAGAATLGTGTFQAATDNATTAASLAAQINAHPVAKLAVTATVLGAVITLTANELGLPGNDITLTYADLGSATIGITLGGLTGGKLAGGDGLFVGTYDGVIAMSSADDSFLAAESALDRIAMHATNSVKAKNLAYALGKLLSNALNWRNQQYITMPFADDVDTLGEAEALFDDKISFVIHDDEYGNRLALLSAGAHAVIAPYVIRNLEVDMQSAALSYISANQPQATMKQAALIQDELQKVIDEYKRIEWIEDGSIQVTLGAEQFVAAADITVTEPTALWRIFGEMRQS